MNRACPVCGEDGSVFINHDNYMAVECIFCHIAWKVYDDGYWERIIGQDEKTWDVITDGSLIIKDEEGL